MRLNFTGKPFSFVIYDLCLSMLVLTLMEPYRFLLLLLLLLLLLQNKRANQHASIHLFNNVFQKWDNSHLLYQHSRFPSPYQLPELSPCTVYSSTLLSSYSQQKEHFTHDLRALCTSVRVWPQTVLVGSVMGKAIEAGYA